MSATAVISAVNHRRIRRARAWLESRVPAEEVLIVGATLDAANELARRVAKEKGAAFGWHRLTLSQLAAAIAAPVLAARGLVPLSRVGTEAIVARLVHRLKAEGGLGHYHAVAATPGFPRAIAGVIAELRLARLPSDAVGSVAPDLVPLIGAYEAELAEAGLTDWPGVLALATEAASRAGPDRHRLIGLPMLLLDVPTWQRSRARLCSCARRGSTGGVGHSTHGGPSRRSAGSAIDSVCKSRISTTRLGVTTASRLPVPAPSRTFSATSSTNRRDHPETQSGQRGRGVLRAGRRPRMRRDRPARARARSRRGIPFDRIAVLLRSPEEYRAHLEEAFDRAGIPAHFARGAVRPDPAGRAFFALLKCAAEGLSARRFAEYLSLGQVPDAAPGGAPPEAAPRGDRWVAPDPELVPQFTTEEVDEPAEPAETDPAAARSDDAPVRDGQLRAPRRWERLLVEAAVIGGRDRWRRRIDGLANELRLRLAELGEEDETQAATLRANARRPRRLRRLRPPSHR